MTILTMRVIRGHFVVTGPDIEPVKFNSGREAKNRAGTIIPAHPSGRSAPTQTERPSRGCQKLSDSEPNGRGRNYPFAAAAPLHVSRNFSPASAGLFVRGGADQGARLAKVVPAMKVAAGKVS